MLICPNCFADPELKGLVETQSKEIGSCSGCRSSEVPILDHTELVDLFQKFANLFVSDVDGDTFVNKVQDDWQIFQTSAIASRILAAIVPELERIETQDQMIQYIPDISESVEYWEIFKKKLKAESRFIINISNLAEFSWDAAFGQEVLFNNKSNQNFYRARIHHESDQDAYHADEMGTPPLDKRTGGRANAFGIPVLYLSLDLSTTLYETRSSLHDELSIGKFRIPEGQSLRLVDFTSSPSIFTGDEMWMIAISKLLCQKISEDLSKPMRRYDSELEYVPTQFICEYIKSVTNADGILFESSLLAGGRNAVVWNEGKMICIDVVKHKVNEVRIGVDVI